RGTGNFIKALQPFNGDQFIFSSTNRVYMRSEPGKTIDEDWRLDASWDYRESKGKTEKVLREQHGDTPIVNLRLAGVYDEEGHSIPLTDQIQRIYENNLTGHFYPGDLLNGNAFVHLEDLDQAFIQTVEKRY